MYKILNKNKSEDSCLPKPICCAEINGNFFSCMVWERCNPFLQAMQTLRTNKKFIRIAALQSGLQPNRKPMGNTFNKVCEKERQFSTVNVFKKYSVIGTKSVKKVSKI